MVESLIILSGPINSGKTTAVLEILSGLHRSEIKAAGIISPKKFEGDKFCGYDAYFLQSGITMPLARIKPSPGWVKHWRFYFSPAAFRQSAEEMRRSKDADIIIVDEVGPLEIQGYGHREGLEKILAAGSAKLLLICRDESLSEIVNWVKPLVNRVQTFNLEQLELLYENLTM